MIPDYFDKSPGGYFSFFDDGAIYIVNETFCTLLGYTKEETTTKKAEDFFTLPTRIFCQTHFFPLLKMQGNAEEIFLTLLTKNGDYLPVLLNARRAQAPQPYTACSFIVVAARKKFEDELVAARKQAETALQENTALQKAKADLQGHAEQLDAQFHLVEAQNNELKQLNHALTHNLKEPLRKILLYTEKLGSYALPAEASATVTRLVTASEQMRNIVSGLQQYIWLNDVPVSFGHVNLEQVFQAAVTEVAEEWGNVLNVETAPLPFIEGDKDQLRLLFYHILSNAVKFRKGPVAHVTILTSLIQQNRFTSVAGKYQYEDFVRLEITDKGIGFEAFSEEAVFELFRKLHVTDGTGLGLALCKKIVANHFGGINATSTPGQGATITVLLPVLQRSSPAKSM